jgi:hypothetical protein
MRLRPLAAVAVSALLALTVLACGGNNGDTYEQPADRGVAGTTGTRGLTVAAIQENPSQYLDQTVTLEAEVDRALGPRAFYLDEDAPAAGGIDNDLLVLTRTAGAAEADPAGIDWGEQRVRVTGKISRMNVAGLERDLGLDFTPEIESELERVQTVLVADSVQRIER